MLAFPSWEEQDRALAQAPSPEAEDYSPLHQALARLPDRLRLPVILYYFADTISERPPACSDCRRGRSNPGSRGPETSSGGG